MVDTETLPPQVRAAFAFVYHSLHVTRPCDSEVTPRALTDNEKAVEHAALEAIRLYITGEMTYTTPGKSDDEPAAQALTNSPTNPAPEAGDGTQAA